MYISKAVINYSGQGERLEVEADAEHMLVKRFEDYQESSEISLGPEELHELLKIAALLDWEGFTYEQEEVSTTKMAGPRIELGS